MNDQAFIDAVSWDARVRLIADETDPRGMGFVTSRGEGR